MRRYLSTVLGSILLVAYLVLILGKVNINFHFVDLAVLLKIAVGLAIVRILPSVKKFLGLCGRRTARVKSTFFAPANKVGTQEREGQPNETFADFLGRSEREVFSPKLVVAMSLAATFLFILFDIFSLNETQDLIMLAFLVGWTLAGGFLWSRGKYSIAAGMLLLFICPFMIVFGKEKLAEKSAVWAYLFFTSGVLQEIVFQYDRRISCNVKRLFLLLKQAGADFVDKDTSVFLSGGRASERVIQPLSSRIGKLNNLSLRYYRSLSEEEKSSFGDNYLEHLRMFCEGVADIYGSLGYYEEEKLYFKVKSSLFNGLTLTEAMLDQKIGEGKILKEIRVMLSGMKDYLPDLRNAGRVSDMTQ